MNINNNPNNLFGDEVHISDELKTSGNVEFGIYLPFGNYASAEITRDSAIIIINHLKKLFMIK